MSNKNLKQLIEKIRASKTVAEEKSVILKETAKIRQQFKENIDEYRQQNILKLLYLNIGGYDTDFGQIDCLKLITSQNFLDKKIGYIALTQLFYEKNDVLMLATNRISLDLQSNEKQIVSISLQALSEIATNDMCLALANDVNKCMQDNWTYIKKKASLAAIRIIRKQPQLIQDFLDILHENLDSKNNGVLMCSLELAQQIMILKPEYQNEFKYHLPNLITILRFFRLMSYDNAAIQDEISDTMAQVLTYGQKSSKSASNAVLLECIKTVSDMKSAITLRKLSVHVFSNLLKLKDNNNKYVCLYTLKKLVNLDYEAVQLKLDMILECLQVDDQSVQKIALDLIFLITDSTNIEQITKQLLDILKKSDQTIQKEISSIICQSSQKFTTSKKWMIKTFVKLFNTCDYLKEENMNLIINNISNQPDIQIYCIKKFKKYTYLNPKQNGLAQVLLWTLGEYGDLVLHLHSEQEWVELIIFIIDQNSQNKNILQHASTCLIKLYQRFRTQRELIKEKIQSLTQCEDLETQERSIEYLALLRKEWNEDRSTILEKMPIFEENYGSNLQSNETQSQSETQQEQKNYAVDLLDIFDYSDKKQENDQTQQQETQKQDLYKDLQEDLQQNIQQDLQSDLFKEDQQETQQKQMNICIQDENIRVYIECIKQDEDKVLLKTNFKSEKIIENLVFQCAVLKYLKLQMNPISGNKIEPMSDITQSMIIINSLQGQKQILIKTKIQYSLNNQQFTIEKTINEIPVDF